MSNRASVLVVGIGGITCSFKSTLAKHVRRLIEQTDQQPDEHVRVEIVHQDTYYLPKEQVPPAPDVGHYDYECPEAMRLDDCAKDVRELIDRYSKTEEDGGEKTKRRTKTIIVVEGIMLYCHRPLMELFDQRYFMFGSYDECKRIRSARTDYIPPDVVGYFDAYVWPWAVKFEAEARRLVAEEGKLFRFLPMREYEKNLRAIMLGVRKWTDVDWLLLTDDELDLQEIARFVTEPGDGAVAVFCGVTRDTFDGKRVVHLEYEAYRSMAYSEMRKLCELVRSKWKVVDRMAVHHRLGAVPVTESSVIIAVSSPHRKEAQQACAFAIDELKSRVPIWKKEIYADGSSTWKENAKCCANTPPTTNQ